MQKGLIFLGVMALSSNSFAVTLNEYLSEVRKENLAFKSSEAKVESATLLANEASLITSPSFFLQAQSMFDTKLGTPPMSMYSKYQNDSIAAGISQQFSFGLQTKLSYSAVKNSYKGSTFSTPKYWDFSPNVELVMPVWGNGFGSTVKAQETLTKAQNDVERLAELATLQGLLVEAEMTYWQLAANQERVKIQEEALSSAKKIYQYVLSQKNKNLGESADVLQANALVEAYTLQLQQAKNEKQRLERAFNKFMNKEVGTKVEDLEKISYSELETFPIPEKRPGVKYDVLIQKTQTTLADASSVVTEERNKPRLDLMGGYTLQGRGVEASKALDNSTSTKYDSGYVGVMFTVPLNFSASDDARFGARKMKEAAKLKYQHAEFNQEEEWGDLKEKMSESRTSLKLARSMENAQKAKLENERIRLRQGRATTYQVLLFEQDYSQAQVSRVMTATELLSLKTQLKLYHGEK